MKVKRLVTLICFVLSIGACFTDISKSNNGFANKLYNVLATKNGNIFFSPISAHACLTMIYQGATGKTANILQHELNLPNKNASALAYKRIMDGFQNTDGVILYMANNIYLQEGFQMKHNFQNMANNFFMANVQNIDFIKKTSAAKQINKWVEKKTHKKIKDTISTDTLNENTRVVLVNAIYFQGFWLHRFRSTTQEKFYLSNIKTIDCQMMHVIENYFYSENKELDAKILKIPYKKEYVNFVIILPNSRNGIKILERKLVSKDLIILIQGMKKSEVVLSLPKFRIETSMDLSGSLKELGLGNIFSDTAEFSNMVNSEEPLKVSNVVQKTFISINENGTEAGAATSVTVRRRRSINQLQYEFEANKPFLFYIIDSKSTVIFIGRLIEPSQIVIHDEL